MDDPALIEECKNAKWSEETLSANGITIHYYHTNPSTPLPKLLFVHGLTDSAGGCIIPISGLAKKYQVFIADNRGHGLTQECPPGTFTVEQMAADSIALIEHISSKEPLLLIGHSMGGAIAANLTKQRPDLVKALVLEDPPWRSLPGQPGWVDTGPPAPLPGGSDGGPPGGRGRGPPGGRGRGPPGGGRGGPPKGGPFGQAKNLQAMSDEEFAAVDNEEGAEKLPPFAHTRLWAVRHLDADFIESQFMAGTSAKISEAVVGISVPTLLQTASHIYPEVAKEALASFKDGREIHYEGEGLHNIHMPPNLDKWQKDVLEFFSHYA